MTGLAVESVETRRAGVTVLAAKARFAHAGAGPGVWPAGVVYGTGSAALAVDDLSSGFGLSVAAAAISRERRSRITVGEVHEAVSAGVAQQAAVVGLAEAVACEVLAGAVGEVGPAVATGASQWRFQGVVWRAVVGGDATFAVDAGGVVLAVETDSAPSEVAVHVKAGPAAVHLCVVEAVEGVAVAVALLTLIGAVGCGWFPR